MICLRCGQSESETCCAEYQQQREEYRAQQRHVAELCGRLGIEVRSSPSQEYRGEWQELPHMESLMAFLAELPFSRRSLHDAQPLLPEDQALLELRGVTLTRESTPLVPDLVGNPIHFPA